MVAGLRTAAGRACALLPAKIHLRACMGYVGCGSLSKVAQITSLIVTHRILIMKHLNLEHCEIKLATRGHVTSWRFCATDGYGVGLRGYENVSLSPNIWYVKSSVYLCVWANFYNKHTQFFKSNILKDILQSCLKELYMYIFYTNFILKYCIERQNLLTLNLLYILI